MQELSIDYLVEIHRIAVDKVGGDIGQRVLEPGIRSCGTRFGILKERATIAGIEEFLARELVKETPDRFLGKGCPPENNYLRQKVSAQFIYDVLKKRG